MTNAPIVYRDGVQVIAAGANYRDIRYGVSLPSLPREADSADQHLLVLDQDQARELAAALTWIISEVDAKNGRASFGPHTPRQRIVTPPPPPTRPNPFGNPRLQELTEGGDPHA